MKEELKLNSVQKVAVFLYIMGLEDGKKVMALMDSDEIKNVIAEFGRLSEFPLDEQQNIRNEFIQMGYESGMNPAETLYVLRKLFNGGKIRDKIALRKRRQS